MKQYTDKLQTAKLIELGFVPKAKIKEVRTVHSEVVVDHDCNFTIGELIEMLPKSLKNSYNPPLVIECNEKWRVYYGVQADYSWEWLMWLEEERNELIDALYDMIVKLKEEGVI